MKTKVAAIKAWRKLMGDTAGFVYQFENGTWKVCTLDSPVAKSLVETGYIYPQLNAKAVTFEAI